MCRCLRPVFIRAAHRVHLNFATFRPPIFLARDKTRQKLKVVWEDCLQFHSTALIHPAMNIQRVNKPRRGGYGCRLACLKPPIAPTMQCRNAPMLIINNNNNKNNIIYSGRRGELEVSIHYYIINLLLVYKT